MDTKTIKLARFANEVLGFLEEEREWSADTVDFIASAAFEYGLATTNEETGYFTMTIGEKADND